MKSVHAKMDFAAATDVVDLRQAVVEMHVLAKGYQDLDLEVPETLARNLTDGWTALARLERAEIERKITLAKSRRAALATAEEKRTALEAEIAALEKKLAQ